MSSPRRLAVALLLSIGALAAGVVAVWRFAESPPVAVKALQRSFPPPSGAFAKGGKPAPGGPALQRVLTTDAPNMMIALDAWAWARRANPTRRAEAEAAIAEAHGRALAPDVRAELGPEAMLKFEGLLDAAKTAVAGTRASSDRLFEAVGAFNDALAAADLGWFIDADVLEDQAEQRRLTLLYFFAVERVTIVGIGGKTVRALEVRRKDRLNWKHTLLGFTRPHLRDALVLLDQIDEQLVRGVLPGLGDSRAVNLFDDDDDMPPTLASRVRARAAEIVRDEYGSTPGIDTKDAVRLGTLLARRRMLFAGWQKLARTRGFVLVLPNTLHAPRDYSRALRGLAPDVELTEFRAIEHQLSSSDIERTYQILRDVLVASVRRHEIQHRLDDLAGDARKMPEPLERYVGNPFANGEPRSHATAARDELSAYLAELARVERTPRANLGRIAEFLLQRRLWGTPESYAALVIFEGLRLDMMPTYPRQEPLVVQREIDREEVANLYLALTEKDPTELRATAGQLWERLFGMSLP